MKKSKDIDTFWKEFLSSMPPGTEKLLEFYDSWHFCDNEKSANELGELVKHGVKTATCSLVWAYEAEKMDLPAAGSYSVITNWDGVPLCIIETTEAEIRPFNEVDDKFAFDEGEGDRSLAYWRKVHWEVFSQECSELGREVVETMPLMCERFRVVYRR